MIDFLSLKTAAEIIFSQLPGLSTVRRQLRFQRPMELIISILLIEALRAIS
jgi:hypothetical protein